MILQIVWVNKIKLHTCDKPCVVALQKFLEEKSEFSVN